MYVINALWAVLHGISFSNFSFLKPHLHYGTWSETAELQSHVHTEVTEDLLSCQLEINLIFPPKEFLNYSIRERFWGCWEYHIYSRYAVPCTQCDFCEKDRGRIWWKIWIGLIFISWSWTSLLLAFHIIAVAYYKYITSKLFTLEPWI